MKNTLFYSSFVALISLLLSACVTINIYFPAAAAEQAADKIIQKVWQLESLEETEQKEDGQMDSK
ncbi:MAG: hypothetical protein Q8K59_04645 [Nitrosomonas sp.]|nr:hypothetical protein [Nitrosomonas sp.]MDP1950378.1 hypothetical protein [Nitrosomonas sp.]